MNCEIIPQDLWNPSQEVRGLSHQEKLDTTGKPFRHQVESIHVLTSLCHCDVCGGPFVVVTGKKWGGYYGCSNAHRCENVRQHKTIMGKKVEPPICKDCAQIQSDGLCAVLADKYNKPAATAPDVIPANSKQWRPLQTVTAAIDEILDSIENGVKSTNLNARLLAS